MLALGSPPRGKKNDLRPLQILQWPYCGGLSLDGVLDLREEILHEAFLEVSRGEYIITHIGDEGNLHLVAQLLHRKVGYCQAPCLNRADATGETVANEGDGLAYPLRT